MSEPAVALIKGPLQWLFRKDAQGRILHGVISAARDWPDIPKDEALRQFEAQIRSLFPRAREATLTRGVIVIEKRATFALRPNVDALRPPKPRPPAASNPSTSPATTRKLAGPPPWKAPSAADTSRRRRCCGMQGKREPW